MENQTFIATGPQLISFVIPAWNEESVLGSTLEALNNARRQLTVPSEVIVANDSSTDRTEEIARLHGAHVVNVQHRQISGTRNAGAKAAHGDLLIFVDADTLVTAEVVGAAVEAVRAGAIGGGCAIHYSGRLPAYLRVLIPIEVWIARKMRVAFGCFLFCTREAFEAVGGFDTTIYATEELNMSQALHRQGRFAILRECVSTSGRKLRTYSTKEWVIQLYRITIARRRCLGNRAAMSVWYDERRPDPDSTP